MSRGKIGKIAPRYRDNSSRKPTKVEVLRGMEDNPQFANLSPKMWMSLYALWDLAAEGKKASVNAVAAEAGVSINAIKRWRTRDDYLKASELLKQVVLHEWEPVILHKAIKQAIAGDRQIMKVLLEYILPKREQNSIGGQINNEITLLWGNEQQPQPPTQPVDTTYTEEPQAPNNEGEQQ